MHDGFGFANQNYNFELKNITNEPMALPQLSRSR